MTEEPWASDDHSWRGDRWLPDWPEEAYLSEGEYALFRRDSEEGTWIETWKDRADEESLG